MEELLARGWKVIGETEGNEQHRTVFFSRKENGKWGYMVVEMSDDNEIYDMVGLLNGKTIKLDQ